MFEIISIAI